MTFHAISAAKLADELIAGNVSPTNQARYLAMSFLVWLLPSYLFLVPPITTQAWYYWLTAYEAITLIVITVAGVFFCLRKCTVNPGRHFLVDFSCLYAPISLTTVIVGWTAFHVLTRGAIALLTGTDFDSEPPRWVIALFSSKFYDLLRFGTYVGITAAVFLRIGYYIERISIARNDS